MKRSLEKSTAWGFIKPFIHMCALSLAIFSLITDNQNREGFAKSLKVRANGHYCPDY